MSKNVPVVISYKKESSPCVNVLHLLNEVGNSSITHIVQRLIQSLDQQRFNWYIGSLNGLLDMGDDLEKIDAHMVDFSERQQKKIASWRSIREYIFENNINIVHTHSLRSIYIIWLALGAKSDTVHVTTKHTLFNSGDRRWGMQYALLDRFGLYLPDHVVVVSQVMHSQISRFPRINHKVTTIYNDISSDDYYTPDQRDACRAELGITPESLIIGWTGRIEKVKRIDLLLLAFASVISRYPNVCLLLVGEGDLKPELERYANQLGISNSVFWTGFRKDVPRLLAAMDIFVQTSVNEGLSLSILEAMAAEKAIIATWVGGTPEVLENGKTGILIPPGKVSSIVNAILYLLEHPELRSKIASEARAFISHGFNTSKMINEYQKLYENLITSRKA